MVQDLTNSAVTQKALLCLVVPKNIHYQEFQLLPYNTAESFS